MSSTLPIARFDGAAVRPRLPSYEKWLSDKQCSTNVMPSWFYDDSECRRRYTAFVERAKEWNASNACPAGEQYGRA